MSTVSQNFPIPMAGLRNSATTTLIAQQVWLLGTREIKRATKRQHKLNSKTASLVSACQALRKYHYRSWVKRRALAKNNILKNYAHSMASNLTTCALAMLSLLAWHFDSRMIPLSRGLIQFFAKPYDEIDSICASIHLSYTKMFGSLSLAEFKEKLSGLLGLLEYHVIKGNAVLYI
ncbi:unnamed protein product [Penicillium salamii]|uniref:Uncharacterized protein n=1 Tax=Penicillium salamii TaxID=1612424 RepID=A0A9W4P081_9EURO|nr:unnamed protein product [Penicillium salamii]CAG7951558.1 unnamed protein product [Penicillium salamii]CAG7957017.1 unnamed protein product [Penicillium salamii]CAG8226510.1 unnamed protein product [Penicillium salamii]CAG8295110.1 unnamed protein product [Penicillium salamii]